MDMANAGDAKGTRARGNNMDCDEITDSDDEYYSKGMQDSTKKKRKTPSNLSRMNRLVVVGECLLGLVEQPPNEIANLSFDSYPGGSIPPESQSVDQRGLRFGVITNTESTGTIQTSPFVMTLNFHNQKPKLKIRPHSTMEGLSPTRLEDRED